MSEKFYNPDLDPEEFRKLGYRVVDMITDYYASIRKVRVFPKATSREVEQVFDEELPVSEQNPDDILNEWQEKVLPYTTHLGSPRYFGYVNGSGSMIGTLAAALSNSVNMNPGGWKASPAATEIERRTIKWIAELIGYPVNCGGLLTSGGTMANFTALLTALRNKAPYNTTEDGLQNKDFDSRFTIYMSDHEGHVSITRVADLLNLGRKSIRRIKSRDDFTMDPEALRVRIKKDIEAGLTPLCVVAQVGSINVGAIDPLEEIAGICRDFDIWFHADGACGAVGAMLPEKKHLYRGLELADSVTLDPHKWLYISYECGCVLVRDEEKLRRSFSMTASYLKGVLPTEYTGLNYFEHGPQMSRSFKALKVWMTLKAYGAEGYRKLLAQNIRCAEYLDKLVRESDDYQAYHKPLLFIYSFRYAPKKYQKLLHNEPAKSDAVNQYLDQLNQTIADEIQISGMAFVMTTRLLGRTVLRLSICSHRTTPEDIDRVFNKLTELGDQFDLGKFTSISSHETE
jgi:aromatic-L-amino-acid/L-tryptophan decarboxylase